MHACLNPEEQRMASGARLAAYVGDCCQYPLFSIRGTGEIFNANGTVCLKSGGVDSDVIFTDESKQRFLSERDSINLLLTS